MNKNYKHTEGLNFSCLLPEHYIEYDYFDLMFKNLDRDLFKDIKIVVSHDYKSIPYYGKDVVVFLTAGDEKGNLPSYHQKVLCVFKHHLDVDSKHNVYHIPLPYFRGFVGTYNVDILKRPYDVCFVGRETQRSAFISSLNKLTERKDLNCFIKITGKKFGQGLSIVDYSNVLENSKISLSPRGLVRSECIRFTESVKCGCSIIADPQPNTRVFNNCPYIAVKDWSKIDSIVDEALSQIELLHQNMKNSWDNYFSPESISMFINKQVKYRKENKNV